MTIDEGQTVVLRCDVSGEEPMNIAWRKSGGMLPRLATVKRNYLEIRKATIQEQARYVCTAKNRYGQASAFVSLFVNQGMNWSFIVLF